MALDLTSCRLKLMRGEEHIDALNIAIKEFMESKPYALTKEFDAASGWNTIRLKVVTKPPARFGTILGDVVHNVRCTLDHLIWQLVLSNGERPTKSNQFPIISDPTKYWKNIRNGRLRGVSETHRAIIDSVQPFQRVSDYHDPLTLLSWLDNVDKHHVVLPAFALVRPPTVGLLDVPQATQFELETLTVGKTMEDGTQVCRARLSSNRRKMKMHVDVPSNIAFSERAIEVRDLMGIGTVVIDLIERFEPGFWPK